MWGTMTKLPPKSYLGVDVNKLAPSPQPSVIIEVEDLHRLLIQAYNDGAFTAISAAALSLASIPSNKKSLPDLVERIAQVTSLPFKG